MKTSRFWTVSAFSCMLATVICTVASAQPPEGEGRRDGGRGGQRGGFGQRDGGRGGRGGYGGRGGFTISRAFLLGNDDVKDELKIDEGQDATIKAALDAYREEVMESRPDRSQFEGLNEEQMTALREKLQKEREALSQKTDDVLNALMEQEQVTRLNEIQVQVRMRMGLERFLTSDDIKEKLKITEDQVAAFDKVREENDAARRAMFEEMRANFGRRSEGDGDGGRAEDSRNSMREKMEKMQKETEEKLMAPLTDSQKTTLAKMKGEPFDLDPRSLMRGRGGFGGGRGGFGGGRGGDRDRGGRDRDRDREGGGRRRPAIEDDSV